MIRRLKQFLNIQNERHSELFDKANKRKIELCEPVPRVAESQKLKGDKMLLKAFTLAEVLVVIGIIGVVSALTIPNLQQGTNTQEVVTKVTKARATIDEAYGRAIATYGDPCLWAQGQTTATAQDAVWRSRILENLKLDKECGVVSNTNTTCWYENGNTTDNYYKAKLSDGTSIATYVHTDNVTAGYGCGSNPLFAVVIDIDGPDKGLGKVCDDIYGFALYGDGVKVSSYDGLLLSDISKCSAWVLTKGNADFLKATLDGVRYKCPNGKYLDGTNNPTCN